MPSIRRGVVDADAVLGGIKSDSVDATTARRIAEAVKAGFALVLSEREAILETHRHSSWNVLT